MQNLPRKSFGILPILVALFIPLNFATGQDTQQGDNESFIVARVDSEPITERDVYQEIDSIASRVKDQLSPAQFAQRRTLLFSHGLDRCIDNILLDQAAEEEGIKIDEQALKEQVQSIREANGIDTDEKYQAFLKAQDLSEKEFLNILRRQMLRGKILDAHTPEADEPSEEDVSDFYEKNPNYFIEDERVRASHILLKVEPDTPEQSKLQIKQKLADIKTNIEEGKTTFEEAAKENSDCPSKARGGDLGYFKKGQMVPEFEKVAFTMDPGAISDVFETQFGYHLVKVTDHSEEHKLPLDEVSDKIKQYLEQQDRQEKIVAYLKSLRDDAEIETLVTEEEWKQRQKSKTGADL